MTSRRVWTSFTILLSTAVAASGCSKKDGDKPGKSKTAPVSPAPAAGETEARTLADKMCACKDVACATATQKEYRGWGKKFAASKPDVEVIKRINVISTRLNNCYKRLRTRAPQVMVIQGDLSTPESVLHIPDADIYLVSNINGSPFAKDDNGFISQVSPAGKITNLKWIDGGKKEVTLNAPKGMTILGGILYVADIDVVRKFDLQTGAPKGEIAIKGATFLNGMASGKDVVYVSDTGKKEGFANSGTDAVWQIKGDKATPVIKDPKLGNPNGLAVVGEDIWAVNFGNAELYKVTGGKKDAVVALPTGALDGLIAMPNGDFLISSWAGKVVYRGPATGPFKPVAKEVQSPADIGWDAKRSRLLVPLFEKNAVRMYTIR